MQTESNAGRVLVVDDEPDVRDLISASLQFAGWETVEAASGSEALTRVREGDISVVTLDINLDRESGYEVCRAIRAESQVPIILVTARTDEFDHVLGLELGADSFLTKPFSPRILVAEVAAAARRSASPEDSPAFRVGSLTLDVVERRVRVAGQEVSLSKTEFDLLELLMSEPRRAFERQTLLDKVWGPWFGDDHVLEVTVGRLRKKLADAGAPNVIETLRGVGYRLSTSRTPGK